MRQGLDDVLVSGSQVLQLSKRVFLVIHSLDALTRFGEHLGYFFLLFLHGFPHIRRDFFAVPKEFFQADANEREGSCARAELLVSFTVIRTTVAPYPGVDLVLA